MTREEMMALSVNDLVTLKKSGKVYRVWGAVRVGDVVPMRVWDDHGKLTTKSLPCTFDQIDFVQQRDGKDYGRLCTLKPENIERVKPGYGDGGPMGPVERKIEADQRPVRG